MFFKFKISCYFFLWLKIFMILPGLTRQSEDSAPHPDTSSLVTIETQQKKQEHNIQYNFLGIDDYELCIVAVSRVSY